MKQHYSPTVFIFAYVPYDPVFLSILNPNSSGKLSVQERSLSLVDTEAAYSPLGVSGTNLIAVALSEFCPSLHKKGTDLFFYFPRPSPNSTFHTPSDLLFNFINKSRAVGQLSPLKRLPDQ